MKLQFDTKSLLTAAAVGAGGFATAKINGCFDYQYKVKDRAAPSSPDAERIFQPDMDDASAIDMLKMNAFFVDKKAMDIVLEHIGDDATLSVEEATQIVDTYLNEEDITPSERRYRRHSLKRAAEAIMDDVDFSQDPANNTRAYGTDQGDAHMESAYNLMTAIGVKGPWRGKIDELLDPELAIDSDHQMNLKEISDHVALISVLTSHASDNSIISVPDAREIVQNYCSDEFEKRRDLAIATLIFSGIKPYCKNADVIKTTAENIGVALDETYQPLASINSREHTENAMAYFECLLDVGLRHGYVDVYGERDGYLNYIAKLEVQSEEEEINACEETRTIIECLKEDREEGIRDLGVRLEFFLNMVTGEY